MTNAPRDISKFVDHLGLSIADNEQLDAQDIARVIEWGNDTKSSVSWVLGDCMNYARDHANDDFMNYLSHRVTLRTLNNYASVCRKFSRERRHSDLSFRHHDAVKGLGPEMQDEWLDKAERQELSSDDLRDSIRDMAAVEKRVVIGNVGSIDKLLKLDMGLPDGYEVSIHYTVITPSNVINLVQESEVAA
jgi:hypothetical protein